MMEMYTTAQIKAWLEAGINVGIAPTGDGLMLKADGSVMNALGHLVCQPDATRAYLYGVHAAKTARSMAFLQNVILLAGGVTDTAPDAADFAVGDLYYDTSDDTLYAVAEGEEGNEWGSTELDESKLYIDALSGGAYVYGDAYAGIRKIGAPAMVDNQAASTAESVAALVIDFNALLSKLKEYEVMAPDPA